MGRYLLPPVSPKHRQMLLARKGGRGISVSAAAVEPIGEAAGVELYELWAVFRAWQNKRYYIAHIDDNEVVIAPLGEKGQTRLVERARIGDILKEKNRIWPQRATTTTA